MSKFFSSENEIVNTVSAQPLKMSSLRTKRFGLEMSLFGFLSFVLAINISACSRSGDPDKVVAISIRGASDAYLDELIANKEVLRDGAFAKIAQNGYRATYLIPIHNAETSAAIATFETGAYPARHGIIGNVYRKKGSPLKETIAGFEKSFACETMWEAADRQGKKVIRIGTFYLNGSRSEHKSVRTIAQGVGLGNSKHVTLSPLHNQNQWRISDRRFERVQPLHVSSVSRDSLKISVLEMNRYDLPLYASAVDTIHDGHKNYQALLLDTDKDLGNGFIAKLSAHQWAAVEVTKEGIFKVGTWVKLTNFKDDLSDVQLYLRAPMKNRGYPVEFVERVEAEVGFTPGYPDFGGHDAGLIDEKTLIEEIERETRYVIEVANYCIRNMNYDLMLIDYPIIDRFGHKFYLKDARHPQYDDEAGQKRNRFEEYLKAAYQLADENINSILANSSSSTAVIVTSGYGFFATHSRIALNRVLGDAGLHVTPDETAEVRALTSTVSANVYINLTGREPQGVVAEADYQRYVDRIISAAADFRDPRSGEMVFDKILTSNELHAVGLLNHQNHAGDVWLRLKAGYTFSGALSPNQPLIDRPRFPGDHGYSPDLPQAKGIFYYLGPRVCTPESKEVEAVDVAVTIGALLQIKQPTSSEGRNIFSKRFHD